LEYLATRNIYPDHWVARIFGIVAAPENLNWIAWGIAALGALAVSFLSEHFWRRWISQLGDRKSGQNDTAALGQRSDGEVERAAQARVAERLEQVKKAGTQLLDPATIAGIWADTLDPHNTVRHLHFRAIKEAISQGKLPGTVLKDGVVNKDARVPVTSLERFWRKEGVLPHTPELDWLVVSDAIERFCDPTLIRERDDEHELWKKSFDDQTEVNDKLGEWNRKHPYGVQSATEEEIHRWQRLCDLKGLADSSEKMNRDEVVKAWDHLRIDICRRLSIGSLMARGFRVPHIGGSAEIDIPASEWRVLDIDNTRDEALRKGSREVIYAGVVIARPHTSLSASA